MSGREEVDFPEPIGRRWVYSIVDSADYFTQPLYFQTEITVFKIGSEMAFLSRCLSFARLRYAIGTGHAEDTKTGMLPQMRDKSVEGR